MQNNPVHSMRAYREHSKNWQLPRNIYYDFRYYRAELHLYLVFLKFKLFFWALKWQNLMKKQQNPMQGVWHNFLPLLPNFPSFPWLMDFTSLCIALILPGILFQIKSNAKVNIAQWKVLVQISKGSNFPREKFTTDPQRALQGWVAPSSYAKNHNLAWEFVVCGSYSCLPFGQSERLWVDFPDFSSC